MDFKPWFLGQFARVHKLSTDLLVWPNPNRSNRRSAVQWYFPLRSKWVFSRCIILQGPKSSNKYALFGKQILYWPYNRRTLIVQTIQQPMTNQGSITVRLGARTWDGRMEGADDPLYACYQSKLTLLSWWQNGLFWTKIALLASLWQ